MEEGKRVLPGSQHGEGAFGIPGRRFNPHQSQVSRAPPQVAPRKARDPFASGPARYCGQGCQGSRPTRPNDDVLLSAGLRYLLVPYTRVPSSYLQARRRGDGSTGKKDMRVRADTCGRAADTLAHGR